MFRPVFDATSGRDGYVSLEVDPTLAYETLQTFREAIDLHETVDRPNLLVKIPATKPGLAAIEDVIAHGRSINVTLIFSLRRYGEVAESYIRGIERLIAAGGDPSKVASVASFFVSRIDTEADRRLDEIDGHVELKGKLAIANARLAYEHYKTAFAGPRWEFLAGKGATPQRVLWASTSTKNPAYPDTLYVDELIGPDTVNTMPGETIEPTRTTATQGCAWSRTWTARTRCSTSWPRRASATRRSPTRVSARESQNSPPRSPSCWTVCAKSRRRSPLPDDGDRLRAFGETHEPVHRPQLSAPVTAPVGYT